MNLSEHEIRKKTHFEKISYIPANGTLIPKLSYISRGNLESLKKKSLLYFFKKKFSRFCMTTDQVIK